MKEREIPSGLNKLGQLGLVLGVLGILGTVAGFATNKAEAFHSYIFAFFFWGGLALGCVAVTLLHHTTTSRWALPIVRMLEAGNKLVPFVFLAFLPIMAGLTDLYPWAMDQYKTDHAIHHRAGWMNPVMFFIRAAIFFAFWFAITNYLNKSNKQQDETGDFSLIQKRSSPAAVSIVIHVIFLTFATTDWIMSLDPHWFSTIFGVHAMIGQALGAMALITLIVTLSAKTNAYQWVVTPRLTRDLGNFLLTFTMLWAYMSLSQFLIIWSGNLPEDSSYYLTRNSGPLLPIGAFVLVGQFFGPFVCLLSGRTKRVPALLAMVAAWILFVRVVDIFWVVKPMFLGPGEAHSLPLSWMDAAAFCGLGGLWLFGFVSNLKKNPLFPVNDPRLQEATHHA